MELRQQQTNKQLIYILNLNIMMTWPPYTTVKRLKIVVKENVYDFFSRKLQPDQTSIHWEREFFKFD